MIASVSMYDEDEDVIVQGSTLHKQLCKLGYKDFETVSVKHMHLKHPTLPTFSDIVLVAKSVYKKLYFIYSWIMQEDATAHSSLSTILNAQVLLNDHASMIDNFIQLSSPKPWNYKLPICIICCLSASAIYLFFKHRNILGFLCPLTFAYSIISMVWLQHCAHNNLKHFVSLQNDLYYLCKKGLKILRSDYKFKSGLGQTTEQFHDLMSDRLCYLQPLMECLISYMENVTFLCYKTSLIMSELLPKNYSVDTLLTKFHYTLFTLHGGVSYQSLKRLYNIHILVQSEMLQLIAIAYNVNTWSESYCKIPEMKLNSICQSLNKHLLMYRDKLKGIIDRYSSSEVKLISLNYTCPSGSKWQELYMQLDVTAHKIQLAYTNVLSIKRDIDAASNEALIDNDRIEIMMKKINDVCKELETAKNFAEISNLTIARKRIIEKDNIVRTREISHVNSELPVVTDTEPEIVDEVFEEYINEQYLKPLLEDDYELDLSESKLDKLLLKNFMSELKEVLIDKHKSMSERETKALQRMYKNVIKDSQGISETGTYSSIPIPPPLPPWNICLPRDNYTGQTRDKFRVLESRRRDSHKDCGGQSIMYNDYDEDVKEESEALSFRLEPPPSQILFKFAPPFMKVSEEVFVGSGENSEEELTDVNHQTDQNTV